MKARWFGLVLVTATMAMAIGKYDPHRYDKAGPKPKSWTSWAYYGNPMGRVQFCTNDLLVWPIKRMLYKRRPITQAKYEELAGKIPKHGVIAMNLANTNKGPVEKLSLRTAREGAELGVCDAAHHVPGLVKADYTGFLDGFKQEPGWTVYECPMPFAPADSFFVHGVTKDGEVLFKTKFYPQP